VTLAEEQFAYATEKVRRLGLQDRVTILLKDFRELDAPPFDKVSSVGMYPDAPTLHLQARTSRCSVAVLRSSSPVPCRSALPHSLLCAKTGSRWHFSL
jgi:hypothetical protein